MTKPRSDARPGRGIKADIFKLLDNNINEIRDTPYPIELIHMLCEAYAFHHCVSNDTVVNFINDWIEKNNIDVSDKE